MKTYSQLVEAVRTNNTRRTQVSNTSGTYRKTGEFLRDKLPAKSKVLSHGAGLDHTKPALVVGLGKGHSVHDFEPNPEGRRTPPEHVTSDSIPADTYDAVVSHNVLNVVEPNVREQVMDSIFRSVKPSGHLIIGVRKWKGDVATKEGTPKPSSRLAKEPRAVWVKKGSDHSYQKGFDGPELKDYVESYAKKRGHIVTVRRLGGIAANAVHVQVHTK